MSISFLKIALVLLVATTMAGCPSSPRAQSKRRGVAKIKFPLDNIRPDGLRGPPSGLVSVSYQFYVPSDERLYQEVRRIDPSVKIFPGKQGGIRNAKDQAFCLGQTNQPRWRAVLENLSSLTYVTEIRECLFE